MKGWGRAMVRVAGVLLAGLVATAAGAEELGLDGESAALVAAYQRVHPAQVSRLLSAAAWDGETYGTSDAQTDYRRTQGQGGATPWNPALGRSLGYHAICSVVGACDAAAVEGDPSRRALERAYEQELELVRDRYYRESWESAWLKGAMLDPVCEYGYDEGVMQSRYSRSAPVHPVHLYGGGTDWSVGDPGWIDLSTSGDRGERLWARGRTVSLPAYADYRARRWTGHAASGALLPVEAEYARCFKSGFRGARGVDGGGVIMVDTVEGLTSRFGEPRIQAEPAGQALAHDLFIR